MKHIILLPTLRNNGGVHKVLQASTEPNTHIVTLLAGDHLGRKEPTNHTSLTKIHYLSRWRFIGIIIAILVWPFWLCRMTANQGPCRITYTHYSTFLCTSIKRESRCFVQGLEWIGLTNSIKIFILQKFIVLNYKYRGWKLITASQTLKTHLKETYKVNSDLAMVWADEVFKCEQPKPFVDRKYDVCMVVRDVTNKRPDLYMDLLNKLPNTYHVLVITPDEKILNNPIFSDNTIIYNGTVHEIKEGYMNSKVLIHLSDYEGFGLPPLESMGCGAVPICRDSIGIRNYLNGDLDQLIMPFDEIINQVCNEKMFSSLEKFQNRVTSKYASVDPNEFIKVLSQV